MKAIKISTLFLISVLTVLFVGVPFSSCKKETTTVHDTTTVTVHVHDTTVVVDTFFDLKDGLVASYNFNGGSLSDASGNGNNIVFNNAKQTTDRFGNANNAFLFDGSSSYMRVKNSATLNPGSITIFAIFKPNGFYTGTCHGNSIVNKGYPDQVNGFYCMRFTDYTSDCSSNVDTSKENLLAGFGGLGTELASPTVRTGTWYNVIFTCDGITAKLYVDGSLVSETAGSISFTGNNHDLFIGKHEDPQYPYYFNGVMDELKIYSRAISEREVKALSSITE
ncbi:MAG TPA: LamG domain-containing protein [Chitinophagaceae bacterium]|nr:LamG domain-containing protein [Chitinophagaceae bacterium]